MTLPHQDKISMSSSYSVAPRHRTVEFGDGYIQRTPMGKNQKRRMLSISYQNLDPATADTIVQFFEGKMDTGDHIDIAANTMLRTAGEFYLQNFDVEMTSPEIRTISASLMEVYDS